MPKVWVIVSLTVRRLVLQIDCFEPMLLDQWDEMMMRDDRYVMTPLLQSFADGEKGMNIPCGAEGGH
jgi:hypothetical protein